jgi:hypothetical protein
VLEDDRQQRSISEGRGVRQVPVVRAKLADASPVLDDEVKTVLWLPRHFALEGEAEAPGRVGAHLGRRAVPTAAASEAGMKDGASSCRVAA